MPQNPFFDKKERVSSPVAQEEIFRKEGGKMAFMAIPAFFLG